MIDSHAQQAVIAIRKLEKPSEKDLLRIVQSAIDNARVNAVREAETATRLFAEFSERKQRDEQLHSEIVAELQNEILLMRNGQAPSN